MITKRPLSSRFLPALRILAALGLVAALATASSVLADEAGKATPEPAPEDGADRVYVLDGATISWDLSRRRYHPPTARQASQLAEEVRLWMEAKRSGGEGRFATQEIIVETLPGGVRRARLPVWLMSFAGADAGGAGFCAEGPAGADETSGRPAAAAVEEKCPSARSRPRSASTKPASKAPTRRVS
jgi:hypothetical protein